MLFQAHADRGCRLRKPARSSAKGVSGVVLAHSSHGRECRWQRARGWHASVRCWPALAGVAAVPRLARVSATPRSGARTGTCSAPTSSRRSRVAGRRYARAAPQVALFGNNKHARRQCEVAERVRYRRIGEQTGMKVGERGLVVPSSILQFQRQPGSPCGRVCALRTIAGLPSHPDRWEIVNIALMPVINERMVAGSAIAPRGDSKDRDASLHPTKTRKVVR